MNKQPSASKPSLTQTALAALIGLLLLTGLSAQGAATSEPLIPLIDDGGPGGIGTGESVEVSRHRQAIEASQMDTTTEGADSKAMLPIARTESMQMRSVFSPGEHADDGSYCFFCFSYR